MGILNNLFKKENVVSYYSDQAFKAFRGYFGSKDGSFKMTQLVEAYGNNPIVFSIINYISGISDGLDKQLLDKDKEIEDGDIFEILRDLNEDALYKNLLATGNVFIRFIRGVGAGHEMEVLNSKDIEILINNSGVLSGYKYTIGNRSITIPIEEILHIRFNNIVKTDRNNRDFGYSPLEAGMKIVTASSEIFNAEAAIFKNRGIVGMLSSGNDMPLFPEDKESIQEAFQDRAGGSENFNKVLVTSSNAKYVQMGMSPTDLKLIENQLSKLRFLCALYGIDSKLLGDGENSTYNNVAEAQKSAYINTILPLSKRVNETLIKFLNTEFDKDYTYEVNRSKIEALKETQTLEQLILELIAEKDMSLEELLVIQQNQNKKANESK